MDVGSLGIERVGGECIQILPPHINPDTLNPECVAHARKPSASPGACTSRSPNGVGTTFWGPPTRTPLETDEQERVVERAKPAGFKFAAAHHDEHAGFLDSLAQGVDSGPGITRLFWARRL